MPDIIMCQNKNCHLNVSCYQYKAFPGMSQSYTHFEPDKNGVCDDYLEVKINCN